MKNGNGSTTLEDSIASRRFQNFGLIAQLVDLFIGSRKEYVTKGDSQMSKTPIEPEAEPLYSDKYVTVTARAVTISGKEYNLIETNKVWMRSESLKVYVSAASLFAAVYFHEFKRSSTYHLFTLDAHPVYSVLFLLFFVFGVWAQESQWLVFGLPNRNEAVLQGGRSWLKKIKAQIERARSAAAPVAPTLKSETEG